MLDLESMIFAQIVICVKKYVETYESPCFGFLSQERGWEIFVSDNATLIIEHYLRLLFLSCTVSVCKPGLR